MKKQADRKAIAVSAALTLLILLGIGGVVLLSGNPLAAAANDKPASVVPSPDGRRTVTPLIASGMVANAGIAPAVALYAHDPAQAALAWQGIETVASGLGNGNGEILGGLWVLLVSLAALRTGGLPKGLNILGLLVGAVGIVSLIPGLTDLVGAFGLGQVIWFVWLAIVLLRS